MPLKNILKMEQLNKYNYSKNVRCDTCGQMDKACAKCNNYNKWIPLKGSLDSDYNEAHKSLKNIYE